MTKHATSKLLMAAFLTIPIFVRAQVVAMSAQAAEAAIGAAADRADDNARQLAQIPVEYAGVTAGLPYGAEGAAIHVDDKTLAGFMDSLNKKTDYWKAVRHALAQERATARTEEPRSIEEAVARARESVRLDREIRAAETLVADSETDIVTVKKVWSAAHDRETGSDILTRKARVFKQLQSLKAP
ncbi:MAG: hypothetical protein ACHQ51_07510 [Elusimicrobiota bacterium]